MAALSREELWEKAKAHKLDEFIRTITYFFGQHDMDSFICGQRGFIDMSKIIEPSVYVSDDYAGVSFNGGSFYYGYEYARCEDCGHQTTNGGSCPDHEDSEQEWCFVAKFDGEEIIIPNSKLKGDVRDNVEERLLMGIGWLFARFELKRR